MYNEWLPVAFSLEGYPKRRGNAPIKEMMKFKLM
jgi:hypothetical protein